MNKIPARLWLFSLLACIFTLSIVPAQAQADTGWETIANLSDSSDLPLPLNSTQCEYRMKLIGNTFSPFYGDKLYYFGAPVLRELTYTDGEIASQFFRFSLDHEAVNVVSNFSNGAIEYEDSQYISELHSTPPFPRGFNLTLSLHNTQGVSDVELRFWNYSRESKKFLVEVISLNQERFELQEKCSG